MGWHYERTSAEREAIDGLSLSCTIFRSSPRSRRSCCSFVLHEAYPWVRQASCPCSSPGNSTHLPPAQFPTSRFWDQWTWGQGTGSAQHALGRLLCCCYDLVRRSLRNPRPNIRPRASCALRQGPSAAQPLQSGVPRAANGFDGTRAQGCCRRQQVTAEHSWHYNAAHACLGEDSGKRVRRRPFC